MNKIDRIIELLESIEAHLANKKKKVTKKGSDEKDPFWEAYADSFRSRWKVDPQRNAMINGMIASIKKRVPAEELEGLARFYLAQNDSWYLREMHHVRCLVKDCEILLTRMKSKVVMTTSKARMMEQASDNLSTSLEYLKRKRGQSGEE